MIKEWSELEVGDYLLATEDVYVQRIDGVSKKPQLIKNQIYKVVELGANRDATVFNEEGIKHTVTSNFTLKPIDISKVTYVKSLIDETDVRKGEIYEVLGFRKREHGDFLDICDDFGEAGVLFPNEVEIIENKEEEEEESQKQVSKPNTLTVEHDIQPQHTNGVHAGQVRMGGGFTVLVINSPFKDAANPFNTVIIDLDFEEVGDYFNEDDLFRFNESMSASAEEVIADFPFVVNGHLTITNGDD